MRLGASMNKIVFGVVLIVTLAGCQSYPKHPSKPQFFDKMVDVNQKLPDELQGINFSLVKYKGMDSKFDNQVSNAVSFDNSKENEVK